MCVDNTMENHHTNTSTTTAATTTSAPFFHTSQPVAARPMPWQASKVHPSPLQNSAISDLFSFHELTFLIVDMTIRVPVGGNGLDSLEVPTLLLYWSLALFSLHLFALQPQPYYTSDTTTLSKTMTQKCNAETLGFSRTWLTAVDVVEHGLDSH